jgi:catechol 2,3-dioxygenase-like lactoylglutathione lyase family enzyme
MIEGISAVTLGTHEMPRAVRFYRTLGFELLHGGEESSFTSFRAGTSYLNLIAEPCRAALVLVVLRCRCRRTLRPCAHSGIPASYRAPRRRIG